MILWMLLSIWHTLVDLRMNRATMITFKNTQVGWMKLMLIATSTIGVQVGIYNQIHGCSLISLMVLSLIVMDVCMLTPILCPTLMFYTTPCSNLPWELRGARLTIWLSILMHCGANPEKLGSTTWLTTYEFMVWGLSTPAFQILAYHRCYYLPLVLLMMHCRTTDSKCNIQQ